MRSLLVKILLNWTLSVCLSLAIDFDLSIGLKMAVFASGSLRVMRDGDVWVRVTDLGGHLAFGTKS